MEQLQSENSRKWRLQERDDWKSLVDSVQADRVRLQEETMQLTLLLEEANNEIDRQAAVLSAMSDSSQHNESGVSANIESKVSSDSTVGDVNNDRNTEIGGGIEIDVEGQCLTPSSRLGAADSPNRRRSSSRSIDSRPGSPSPRHSVQSIQQLKMELQNISNQVEYPYILDFSSKLIIYLLSVETNRAPDC